MTGRFLYFGNGSLHGCIVRLHFKWRDRYRIMTIHDYG